MATAMPLWCSDVERTRDRRAPASVPSTAHQVAADRAGEVLVAADPHGLAHERPRPRPLHRADVDHRRPPVGAGPRDRCAGCRPPRPAPDASAARTTQRAGAPGVPAHPSAERRRRRPRRARRPPWPGRSRVRARRRHDAHRASAAPGREPEPLAGRDGLGPKPRAPRSTPRPARRCRPRAPIQARTHPGRARPASRPSPERPGRRRQQPRGHTVTWSRISSSVDGPMPLTSSSSSTEANGPFSVR